MSNALPLSFAILLTAVGCECQETVYRAAPVERTQVTASGLFDRGKDDVTRDDYQPAVYRLDARPTGYDATFSLGYGNYDPLLIDPADRVQDPPPYSGDGDAFALEMRRSGMRDVDDERTLVEHDFEVRRFHALIGGVEYVDRNPSVDFAIDLATGAIRADVEGELVPVDDDDHALSRSYTARFDAIGVVECWQFDAEGNMTPPWEPAEARADCPHELAALPKTDETPAPPWSLDGPQDETVCGLY